MRFVLLVLMAIPALAWGNPSTEAPRERLTPAVRTELETLVEQAIDPTSGGLRNGPKALELTILEQLALRASEGSAHCAELLRLTLSSAKHLQDPETHLFWPSAVGADWSKPLIQRSLSAQARALLLFGYGYQVTGDETLRTVAIDVARAVGELLTRGDGAFDLNGSAAQKSAVDIKEVALTPALQGELVVALSESGAITGEASIQSRALRGAQFLESFQRADGGAWRSEDQYELGDAVSAANAYLSLYHATGEKRWLAVAISNLRAIIDRLRIPEHNGVAEHLDAQSKNLRPPQAERNLALARVAARLFYATGDPSFREIAIRAYSFGAKEVMAQPAHARSIQAVALLLLADRALFEDPLHVTVVGAKGDTAAAHLFAAAHRHFDPDKRVEWWDRSEGPLPRMEVPFPTLPRAAAFICTNSRCSLPIFDAARLPSTIEQMLKGASAR